VPGLTKASAGQCPAYHSSGQPVYAPTDGIRIRRNFAPRDSRLSSSHGAITESDDVRIDLRLSSEHLTCVTRVVHNRWMLRGEFYRLIDPFDGDLAYMHFCARDAVSPIFDGVRVHLSREPVFTPQVLLGMVEASVHDWLLDPRRQRLASTISNNGGMRSSPDWFDPLSSGLALEFESSSRALLGLQTNARLPPRESSLASSHGSITESDDVKTFFLPGGNLQLTEDEYDAIEKTWRYTKTPRGRVWRPIKCFINGMPRFGRGNGHRLLGGGGTKGSAAAVVARNMIKDARGSTRSPKTKNRPKAVQVVKKAPAEVNTAVAVQRTSEVQPHAPAAKGESDVVRLTRILGAVFTALPWIKVGDDLRTVMPLKAKTENGVIWVPSGSVIQVFVIVGDNASGFYKDRACCFYLPREHSVLISRRRELPNGDEESKESEPEKARARKHLKKWNIIQDGFYSQGFMNPNAKTRANILIKFFEVRVAAHRKDGPLSRPTGNCHARGNNIAKFLLSSLVCAPVRDCIEARRARNFLYAWRAVAVANRIRESTEIVTPKIVAAVHSTAPRQVLPLYTILFWESEHSVILDPWSDRLAYACGYRSYTPVDVNIPLYRYHVLQAQGTAAGENVPRQLRYAASRDGKYEQLLGKENTTYVEGIYTQLAEQYYAVLEMSDRERCPKPPKLGSRTLNWLARLYSILGYFVYMTLRSMYNWISWTTSCSGQLDLDPKRLFGLEILRSTHVEAGALFLGAAIILLVARSSGATLPSIVSLLTLCVPLFIDFSMIRLGLLSFIAVSVFWQEMLAFVIIFTGSLIWFAQGFPLITGLSLIAVSLISRMSSGRFEKPIWVYLRKEAEPTSTVERIV
jgi:hypothetical protein